MKAIEKIKNKVLKSKTSKYVATAMFAAAVAVMGCINCFAADVDFSTIMQTAFNTVKSDIISVCSMVKQYKTVYHPNLTTG